MIKQFYNSIKSIMYLKILRGCLDWMLLLCMQETDLCQEAVVLSAISLVLDIFVNRNLEMPGGWKARLEVN